jgi:hypothetical protein
MAMGGLDKIKRCIVIPAYLFLAAAGTDFPTEEEQEKIARPYSECMRIAAERIDDGQTDIAVLGKSVAKTCRPEFVLMVAALGKNLSSEDQKRLEAGQRDMEIGYATAAVGKARHGRSETNR